MHVYGEHLGRWSEGVARLEQLGQLPCLVAASEGDRALTRGIASLQLASGERSSVDDLALSDQVMVMAVAASALSEQLQPARARTLFVAALTAAQSGLDNADPALRALAVTGNNLACALEEKSGRSAEDTDLMLLAATTARKYWEIVGGSKTATAPIRPWPSTVWP